LRSEAGLACNHKGPELAFCTIVFGGDGGVLRVDAPLATYRMRWQPEAKAVELLVAPDRWVACWPDFRLLKPELPTDEAAADQSDKSGRDEAFSAFRAQIPPDIASAVQGFPSHQWPLLEMIARQPLSLDLVLSNPALAFALANNNTFRRTKIEAAGFQAAAYAIKKQRWILEWLGFPGSKAVEKLMRKIPPEHASLPLFRRLQHALESHPDVMDLLSHRRVITHEILQITTNGQILALIEPVLLDEIEAGASQEDGLSVGDLLLDIVRILEEIAPRRHIPRLQSIERIRSLRTEIEVEYALHLEQQEARRAEARLEATEMEKRKMKAERIRRELERWPDAGTFARAEAERREAERRKREEQRIWTTTKFQNPPIPGTEDIIPITTAADLWREGRSQKNCVATRLNRILQGQCYIYRVMAPERATLSIAPKGYGTWGREELEASHNRHVQLRSTTNAVDAWLREYNPSV